MTIADRRFIRFLSFIENFYEVEPQEYAGIGRLKFNTTKSIPKIFVMNAQECYLALKRNKDINRFVYRDKSKITFYTTSTIDNVLTYNVRTSHFAIRIKVE